MIFLYGALIVIAVAVLAAVGEKVVLGPALSAAGKRIMDDYYRLPKESRNKISGLRKKLQALDAELGRLDVDKHFRSRERYFDNAKRLYAYRDTFSWNNCPSHDKLGTSCKFCAYWKIKSRIEGLLAAVEEQRLAEQRAGIDAIGIAGILEAIEDEKSTVKGIAKAIEKSTE